jgi:hypothetical protein
VCSCEKNTIFSALKIDKSGFLLEEKRVAILLTTVFFFQSMRNWVEHMMTTAVLNDLE